MSRVVEAICWDGVYVTLGMYTVFRQEPDSAALQFCFDAIKPIKPVKPFRLDDELQILGGRPVIHYEIRLANVPEHLEQYLGFCLRNAFESGANCSWFGFEGSFDFEHILTTDIADQIYGICGTSGDLKIALEDSVLLSDEWRETVSSIRKELVG